MESAVKNHRFVLAKRPVGMPDRSVWDEDVTPVRAPEAGEVLVKVLYLSLDPAMRGWMNDVRSYIPPVKIGEVMRAGGVGRIVESTASNLHAGDYVSGVFGIQEYATLPAAEVKRIDPNVAPLPVHLSVLGMPGMTAYFGLLDIGKPKPGETVVVSGAAGAVGLVVGQVAKIKGARVIGIAGGPEKCAFLRDDLGYDGTIDYKSEAVHDGLRRECPKGIDIYFDNVGGDTLDDCLAKLRMHARVIICGAISQYNNTTPVKGPSNYLSLLVNRASMTGMVVFDYADRFAQAETELAGWIADGSLRPREDIVDGIETFPETLLKLFKGENFGKLILKVADDVA